MPLEDIPTKNEWREARQRLGIPSKLTGKVSMGKEFKSFWKIRDEFGADFTSKKIKKVIKALEILEGKVDKYREVVKTKPSDIFGGENEKQAVIDYFEDIDDAPEFFRLVDEALSYVEAQLLDI